MQQNSPIFCFVTSNALLIFTMWQYSTVLGITFLSGWGEFWPKFCPKCICMLPVTSTRNFMSSKTNLAYSDCHHNIKTNGYVLQNRDMIHCLLSTCETVTAFKSPLKTHLFKLSYCMYSDDSSDVVRDPCSDSRHVTVPYKLTFYYYYYCIYLKQHTGTVVCWHIQ